MNQIDIIQFCTFLISHEIIGPVVSRHYVQFLEAEWEIQYKLFKLFFKKKYKILIDYWQIIDPLHTCILTICPNQAEVSFAFLSSHFFLWIIDILSYI